MRLSGTQHERICLSLIDAFPTWKQLAALVRHRLGQNLAAIAGEGNLRDVTFELVRDAEAQGYVADLVAKAYETTPGNSLLHEVAEELGLVASPVPAIEKLERVVRPELPPIDVALWRSRLGEIEARVCRILLRRTGKRAKAGTGFLVGPDVIMTCQHVIEGVPEMPSSALVQFDYKRTSAGTEVTAGTSFRLAAREWLVDSGIAGDGNTHDDGLDYALLRLERAVGAEPIGGKGGSQAQQRGWIELPREKLPLEKGDPLLIVQHPKGEPMKLALDTEAIEHVTEDGRQVQYRTNTDAGASGAPCFDLAWNLVAIHVGAMPGGTSNAGIPMDAIVESLQGRGVLERIGAGRMR